MGVATQWRSGQASNQNTVYGPVCQVFVCKPKKKKKKKNDQEEQVKRWSASFIVFEG